MTTENNTNPVSVTSTRPYELIHEIYVLFDACDRQVLDSFSLNNSQYRVFSLLSMETGLRMTVLGERLMLSKSTITRIVDQLEERSWVRRIPDPVDRRAQDVILTPEGKSQRAAITQAHMQSLIDRMSQLDPGEQTHLINLLDKLSTGLRSKIEAQGSNGASA